MKKVTELTLEDSKKLMRLFVYVCRTGEEIGMDPAELSGSLYGMAEQLEQMAQEGRPLSAITQEAARIDTLTQETVDAVVARVVASHSEN